MVPNDLIDRITCCDGVEGMRRLPAGSVPLTVTSPPWGEMRTYGGHVFDLDKCEEFAYGLRRVTSPGGVVCWHVADGMTNWGETGESFRQALLFMSVGFKLHQTIAVDVDGAYRRRRDNEMFPPQHVFVFSKGRPAAVTPIRDVPNVTAGRRRTFLMRGRDGSVRNGGTAVMKSHRCRGPVWRYPTGSSCTTKDREVKAHPAKMPETLAADLIRMWSRPGDLVLDPFAGSGTTLKAAWLEGRRSIGFEVEPGYVGIARRRLTKYGPPTQTLA